jgi:hypothetical protein
MSRHIPSHFCKLIYPKPAKRKAAEAPAPKARQSKLAKEHNITRAEENEIKEAFALFSVEEKGEKEGVIPIGDVRRAMMCVSPLEATPPTPHFPLLSSMPKMIMRLC